MRQEKENVKAVMAVKDLKTSNATCSLHLETAKWQTYTKEKGYYKPDKLFGMEEYYGIR